MKSTVEILDTKDPPFPYLIIYKALKEVIMIIGEGGEGICIAGKRIGEYCSGTKKGASGWRTDKGAASMFHGKIVIED